MIDVMASLWPRSTPHDHLLRLAAPLLRDAIRAVRIEAARLLAPLDTARLSAEQHAALDLALVEYRQAQELNADRPEAHLNLGVLQAQLGKPLEAERAYRTALRIDPSFAPTYMNLADLYRAQNRDEEGEKILRQGLTVSPNDAALHSAHQSMLTIMSYPGPDGRTPRSSPGCPSRSQ
jgi:tetratricopeptide (TPR) repeat protein